MDGNYVLCSQMAKITGRIVDQVLAPPSLPLHAAGQMAHDQPSGTVDFPLGFTPEDDMQFLQWLDGVDWQKGPYMNLG